MGLKIITVDSNPVKSQKAKILELLENQPDGVSNFQLNKIAFRFSARLKELRDDGYDIQTFRGKKKREFIFKLLPKNRQLELLK